MTLDPGLDAALAVADFGKAARVVLREALVQMYGPERAVIVTLSPTKIAAVAGQHAHTASEAIRRLVYEQVLTRVDECRYILNRDYFQWQRATVDRRGRFDQLPLERRLSAAELSYCRSSSTGVPISVFRQRADLMADSYSRPRRRRRPSSTHQQPTGSPAR